VTNPWRVAWRCFFLENSLTESEIIRQLSLQDDCNT
jgi:hypothetical protein